MWVTAVNHLLYSERGVCSAVRHSSLSAESARNCAKLWHCRAAYRPVALPHADLITLEGAYGFLIPTALDQRAVESVQFVLARFGVQTEEDEKARIMGTAVPLRAAAGGRVLSASTWGALRVVGRTFRSCKRYRGVGRCCAHRRWRGHRDLGTLASGHQLERSRDPQGRTRTDSQRSLPEHPPSDLHRNFARAAGHRGRRGRSTRLAGRGCRLAFVLHQGPPRRILPHPGIRRPFCRTHQAHRHVPAPLLLAVRENKPIPWDRH